MGQTNYTSKPRKDVELDSALKQTWFLHFSLPIEVQVEIDSKRLLPVFETMRLYKLAKSGKLKL